MELAVASTASRIDLAWATGLRLLDSPLPQSNVFPWMDLCFRKDTVSLRFSCLWQVS